MSGTTEADVDYWPTPDNSTYVKAARAGILASPDHKDLPADEVDALVAKALTDPVFHAVVEAVWADRLPTPDAHYRACRALDKHRLRGEVLAGEVDRLLAELATAREEKR